MSKGLAVLLSVLAIIGAAPSTAPTADSVMRRIDARNDGLSTFETRVHVNLKLLSFPWLSSSLDGTEYYKRPDKHGVVFDRSPSYAKGIKSLFGAIDAPSEWRKDSNVTFAGTQNIAGRPSLLLRMTKKIYSDQLRDVIAYVDPASYEVTRMDFNYTNGDRIVMTQTYKTEGRYVVVATRHLDIARRVHAVADATYATYRTNVALNDAVFQQKQ